VGGLSAEPQIQPRHVREEPVKDSGAGLRGQPDRHGTTLNLKIYNDINVFFGSKGTGKSKILEAIGRYYSEKGIAANVFESGVSTLTEKYGLNSKSLPVNLEDYSINYCTIEIEFIKKSKEENITNISNYQQYFLNRTQNKNAKKYLSKTSQKRTLISTNESKNLLMMFLMSSKTLKSFRVRMHPLRKLLERI
jgi:DNA repair ATPase RecN